MVIIVIIMIVGPAVYRFYTIMCLPCGGHQTLKPKGPGVAGSEQRHLADSYPHFYLAITMIPVQPLVQEQQQQQRCNSNSWYPREPAVVFHWLMPSNDDDHGFTADRRGWVTHVGRLRSQFLCCFMTP